MVNQTPCPFVNMLLTEKRIKNKDVNGKDIVHAIQDLKVLDGGLMLFIKMIIKVFTDSNDTIKNMKDIKEFEHDVSMFRLDKYNGDYVSFNPKLFKQLKRKSADKKYLTLDNMIEFKRERVRYCQKNNPQLNLGAQGVVSGSVESALLYVLFSDETSRVRIDWLEYFLTHEKFPYKLGFQIKQISSIETIQVTTKLLIALTPLLI